jgi:TonB family protein
MAIALAVLSADARRTAAQTEGISEYQVKAAYLYNFVKSSVWPEQSLPNGAQFIIGVVGGDDEFVDTLKKTVSGKTAGTHSISVKRADSIADLDVCHLVFFRVSAGRKRVQAAIAVLDTANILLVGEEEDFLREGGMINLVLKNGTVRFEVDRASLERADIRLSPALLALANPSRGSGGTTTKSVAALDGGSRKLKTSSTPEYPEIAQRMNIKGAVQVEASVRRDGTVTEVKVIGGHPLLADALVKAVKGWQYEPAAKDSQVVVRFVFGQ